MSDAQVMGSSALKTSLYNMTFLFFCPSLNQKRNRTSYEFLKYNKTIISVGVFLVLFQSSTDNIAVLYLKNCSIFFFW